MIHWFWEILVPLTILLWQKHWDLMDQTPKKQNNAIFLVIILVACGCQNCMIEYVLLFSLVRPLNFCYTLFKISGEIFNQSISRCGTRNVEPLWIAVIENVARGREGSSTALLGSRDENEAVRHRATPPARVRATPRTGLHAFRLSQLCSVSTRRPLP